MKIDIFNIEEFIQQNHCPQVTNPIFFNYDTTPTIDGLFSYELFGVTDEERKNTFGYIDLNGHYLHPLIFNLLKTRMGSLRDIIYGEKYAVVVDKKIRIVDETFEGAETGIDFFYNNFDKLKNYWGEALQDEELDSIDKATRLKFLKTLKKDEFFVSKWLVLPPFYRAESSTNQSMGDSVNKLYKDLINKTRLLKTGFSFQLFGSETKIKIQHILLDIYFATTAPVSGKNLILEKGKDTGDLKGNSKTSILRKHLIGKSVDWTASSVITAPVNSSAMKFNQKPVPFGYVGIPLASLLSLFAPFFISECSIFLETYLSQIQNMPNISKVDLKQFNSDKVEKLMKKFITSPNDRFDPITFEIVNINGKKEKKEIFIKARYEAGGTVERPLTITDLFYQVAYRVLSDKHVYITRYPVANHQNIFPAKVKILTTDKTEKIKFEKNEDGLSTWISETYDEYPYIDYDNEKNVESTFYDVMLCGNAYLASLGGDYDGDMLYMKAVFSKEANDEAERIIFSKKNLFQANGELSRSISGIGKDCIMGLYELTKEMK